MPQKYRAVRDLSFVSKGRTFTEAKVPDGVSLTALLRGGIVHLVHPPKDEGTDDGDGEG